MEQINFITAFGRLLRDGALRDNYLRDAATAVDELALGGSDREAALALDVKDLEAQAEVLLRKRFEAVCRLIPQTMANAGAEAWKLFRGYARYSWPTGEAPVIEDACGFCAYLTGESCDAISTTEFNRLAFVTGNKRFQAHFVSDFVLRNRKHHCVQVLYRKSGRSWREVVVHFGF